MDKQTFFARTKDDIPKAAVDFFSIGHILMGQIAYFITYALINMDWGPLYESVGFPEQPNSWAILVAIIFGIIWEPVENILLWKWGLKFESKQDSWLNLIFDILFVTSGAVISYFIHIWQVNLTLVVVEFILFFILRWYFLEKT